mmetsp:Transcript_11589/g.29336  ORF Transcript_11589/g.29336 Transcript_11589/m.29336 type:complete len:259 (-) Transcript_11589:63-839(-)
MEHPRAPEVRQKGPPALVDQNVLRRDVAVADALEVYVLERTKQVEADSRDVRRGQNAARGLLAGQLDLARVEERPEVRGRFGRRIGRRHELLDEEELRLLHADPNEARNSLVLEQRVQQDLERQSEGHLVVSGALAAAPAPLLEGLRRGNALDGDEAVALHLRLYHNRARPDADHADDLQHRRVEAPQQRLPHARRVRREPRDRARRRGRAGLGLSVHFLRRPPRGHREHRRSFQLAWQHGRRVGRAQVTLIHGTRLH